MPIASDGAVVPPPEAPAPRMPKRKPLKEIQAKKPPLTEETRPSAKVYLGPPDPNKFFRVLPVDGLVEVTGTDAAGAPVIEFIKYYSVRYEGVEYLVLGATLKEELSALTHVSERYLLPCVTEDGVFTLWTMAAVDEQKPTQRRSRCSKDAEQAKVQGEIISTMRKNKEAAVTAVNGWIRRVSAPIDGGRTVQVIRPQGRSWATRVPERPEFDPETWVYEAYGVNVISDMTHDVVLALQGNLDA
jgi:hypothetical protein